MKIGVIGLGLIGGSIFKRLNLFVPRAGAMHGGKSSSAPPAGEVAQSAKGGYDVIGVSRSVKEFGVSEDYSTLNGCDIVFVCTPMTKTLEILDKLENYLDENTIVTDVCSLKEFVSHKSYKFKFIPSHPMAGTEHNGWEHSFPELFEGATWAVTLKEDTDLKDFEKLKSVINDLGAETIMTTSREHDRAVALISHAPMLVAQALCKNIENNELAQKLASSGFRDTTRLALSNTEMANDMIVMNGENIKDVVSLLNNNIDKILESDYKKTASEIKNFRQKLYN